LTKIPCNQQGILF